MRRRCSTGLMRLLGRMDFVFIPMSGRWTRRTEASGVVLGNGWSLIAQGGYVVWARRGRPMLPGIVKVTLSHGGDGGVGK